MCVNSTRVRFHWARHTECCNVQCASSISSLYLHRCVCYFRHFPYVYCRKFSTQTVIQTYKHLQTIHVLAKRFYIKFALYIAQLFIVSIKSNSFKCRCQSNTKLQIQTEVQWLVLFKFMGELWLHQFCVHTKFYVKTMCVDVKSVVWPSLWIWLDALSTDTDAYVIRIFNFISNAVGLGLYAHHINFSNRI